MDAAQFNELVASLWPYLLVILTLIFGMLAQLARLLYARVDAWFEKQMDKLDDEVAESAIRATKEEAEDIVLELSQTMVPEIRSAAADGKITSEERTKLRDTALGHLKKRTDLSTLAKALESRGFPIDELDDWLIAQIESRVGKMNILGAVGRD